MGFWPLIWGISNDPSVNTMAGASRRRPVAFEKRMALSRISNCPANCVSAGHASSGPNWRPTSKVACVISARMSKCPSSLDAKGKASSAPSNATRTSLARPASKWVAK